MKNLAFSLVALSIILLFSCGSEQEIDDDETQLTYSEEVINKFSDKEVRLFLSTPYKEDREPEFSDYVKMLTDKRVDQQLKNQLINLVQDDNADRFYVANMIYLMSKAKFSESMQMIKEHIFDPDIYTQVRCIKAFQYVAKSSEKNILLDLISSNVESKEVVEIAEKVYLTLVTKDDFDELFKILEIADEQLCQDSVQKSFIIKSLNYCLDEKHSKNERKTKDLILLKKLETTSQLAQEFIITRLKGRLTHPNIKVLVNIYCLENSPRSLHALVFEEILRLFASDGDKINVNDLNIKFEQILTLDLIESANNSDIKPKGAVFILNIVGLGSESQEKIENYLKNYDLSDVSSYTVLQGYKLLMDSGELTSNIADILRNAINNRQLRDYSISGLDRMVNAENIAAQPNVIQLIFDYVEIATKQQNINKLTLLLSKLNTDDAIAKLLKGLHSKSKIITAACSEAIISLIDKSYFTLEIRQSELIENILRNDNVSKHDIIAALNVLGEIGTKSWDKQLMQQYCRLQDDTDVARALEKAVEQIDSRES